jgi:membrane-associated phospholipid phosphatase
VLARPWLLAAARTATTIGSPLAVDLLTAAAVVVLLLGRRWRAIVLLVVARFGELAFETGLKELLGRPRPVFATSVATASGYSFPSGHAAGTAAGYGAIVLLALPLAPRWARPPLLGACALLAVAVAASRVLLGVHYPSDVTAGAALGLAWIGVAAFLATRPLPRRPLPARSARRAGPTREHEQQQPRSHVRPAALRPRSSRIVTGSYQRRGESSLPMLVDIAVHRYGFRRVHARCAITALLGGLVAVWLPLLLISGHRASAGWLVAAVLVACWAGGVAVNATVIWALVRSRLYPATPSLAATRSAGSAAPLIRLVLLPGGTAIAALTSCILGRASSAGEHTGGGRGC